MPNFGLQARQVRSRKRYITRTFSRVYFSLGPTGKAYRPINQFTPHRLCRWLCRKHKVRNSGANRFPYEYLYDTLGLVELSAVPADFPRAMA